MPLRSGRNSLKKREFRSSGRGLCRLCGKGSRANGYFFQFCWNGAANLREAEFLRRDEQREDVIKRPVVRDRREQRADEPADKPSRHPERMFAERGGRILLAARFQIAAPPQVARHMTRGPPGHTAAPDEKHEGE